MGRIMKLKYYTGVLLTASVALLSQSCDDFLDTQPISQSIADVASGDTALYKNASEVEGALAGAYSDFKNEYFMLDYFVNGDAQSDNSYAGADNPSNFQIDEYDIDATNSNVSR